MQRIINTVNLALITEYSNQLESVSDETPIEFISVYEPYDTYSISSIVETDENTYGISSIVETDENTHDSSSIDNFDNFETVENTHGFSSIDNNETVENTHGFSSIDNNETVENTYDSSSIHNIETDEIINSDETYGISSIVTNHDISSTENIEPGENTCCTSSAENFEGKWENDDDAKECRRCQKPFNVLLRRRHHCRRCGQLVCYECSRERTISSDQVVTLSGNGKPIKSSYRICTSCYDLMNPEHSENVKPA
ncbi:13427_t:CDS:2, partial [Racocetra persica]